ncbi:MAG: hypothetical protein KDD33_05710 [Bdellovibrionales bacterium]|nr:hypothetical protein [Bdellovibrionales bacterium]
MEIQILNSSHIPELIQWEKARMISQGMSEAEVEMLSWQSSWREESLEHYAQLGWSFVAADSSQVSGYLLAQPFLFMNGWTQSLWVDRLSFEIVDVGHQLFDTILRWAKTKHLQKVLANSNDGEWASITQKFPTSQEGHFLHFSTTKLSED